MTSPRIVTAHRHISAPAAQVFELIADPDEQPRWDGNENLAAAEPGQRVTGVGAVFTTTLTNGGTRENHVVEFDEGRLIAWRPADVAKPPPGHLWRWELSEVSSSVTWVRHTYDWTELADEMRLARARATGVEQLQASVDRLAALAERSSPSDSA